MDSPTASVGHQDASDGQRVEQQNQKEWEPWCEDVMERLNGWPEWCVESLVCYVAKPWVREKGVSIAKDEVPENVLQVADGCHRSDNHSCLFLGAVFGFQLRAADGHVSVDGESHSVPDGAISDTIEQHSVDITHFQLGHKVKLSGENDGEPPHDQIQDDDQQVCHWHRHQVLVDTTGQTTFSPGQDDKRYHIDCVQTRKEPIRNQAQNILKELLWNKL